MGQHPLLSRSDSKTERDLSQARELVIRGQHQYEGLRLGSRTWYADEQCGTLHGGETGQKQRLCAVLAPVEDHVQRRLVAGVRNFSDVIQRLCAD